jgi:hypothetical protein
LHKGCGRGAISISFLRCETCAAERPDRPVAARHGAAFISNEHHGASKGTALRGLRGEEVGAGAARPHHIDLRAGDQARDQEALAAHLRPCNDARQLSDPLREGGIKACGASEAVLHRIARGSGLALRRSRGIVGPRWTVMDCD